MTGKPPLNGNCLPFSPKLAIEHVDAPVDQSGFERFERQFAPLLKERDQIYRCIPGGESWPSFEPPREKLLEYYLTLEALQLKRQDTYLDVASCLSLFPNYVAEMTGAGVIRQDLHYTPNLVSLRMPRFLRRGLLKRSVGMKSIGCDACEMPLPDESVDAIALHCSFEHFEGDSDGRFAVEAMRLLRPGGRLLIIPFYCGDKYTEVFKEEFALGCQFQRYYDPPSFEDRILKRLNDPYRITIRYYRNVREVDPSFYCDYSLCLQKPAVTPGD